MSQTSYKLLGSPGSPVLLTTNFTDHVTNAVFFRYHRRFRLEGNYTPAATNSYLQLLVEYSNDDPALYPNGGPVYWRPLVTEGDTPVEVDDFANQGTNMGTRAGIPIVIPGGKLSTIAVAIPFTYLQNDVIGFWIRVSAREQSTGAFGTTDLEITIQD